MSPGSAPSVPIRFGPADATSGARGQYTLDLDTLELRRGGQPICLRPRAARLLAVLLRHGGRLVSTAELRRELWGDRHVEWRNGLHRCVRDLRRALADDARQPRFVATVARLGYRFVGERPRAQESEFTAPSSPARLVRGFRRPSVAFATGFAAALLLPVIFLLACLALATPW